MEPCQVIATQHSPTPIDRCVLFLGGSIPPVFMECDDAQPIVNPGNLHGLFLRYQVTSSPGDRFIAELFLAEFLEQFVGFHGWLIRQPG